MKHSVTDDKLREVVAFKLKHGKSETLKTFDINEETLSRYLREAKERNISGASTSRDITEILENYTEAEIRAIAKGGRLVPGMMKVPVISFEGEHIRWGSIGDTHNGSLYSDPDFQFKAFEQFKKSKVDFITHGGDVFEGMSNRPGHIYELSHLGYDKQNELCKDIYSQWTDTPMYFISGNHDRWFLKSAGVYAVKRLCEDLNLQTGSERYIYLGEDEGDISLKGVTTVKLWHGEDGNTYALSYRLQKIIESISGGEKPGVMMFHHVHKFVYIFERMIHCVSTGAMQRQTKWMRGKRIASHTGFTVNDAWVNKNGIARFGTQFYPFYT